MKKLSISLLLTVVSMAVAAQSHLSTKPSNGSGAWTQREVTLVRDLPGYTPVTAKEDINRYGSSSLIKEKSTGFFYTRKIGDRWWVIDPDGYAGMSVVMNSVYKITPSQDIPLLYDHLKTLGYNGTGNFLFNEEQTMEYNQLRDTLFSYTRRINFFLTYKDLRRSHYPSTPAEVSGSLNYIFVLDPEFEKYCDELARQKVAPYRNERNLMGYFLDNEINFNQDQLVNMLDGKLIKGDPSFDAALKFAAERGYTQKDAQNGKIPDSVKEEFAVMLAEHYFKVTSAAVKKYDPNHLNLGSRLHGRPRDIEGVVKASARYCDIVSVNFYDKFCPDDQITSPDRWMKWIDVPCLVTEFYTKGYDATTNGYVNGYAGAGWLTKNQTERGYFYQHSCLQLLKSKQFVGWHYFKFQDDDNSNKGIYTTSAKGRKEYTECTSWMKELNLNVYNLIDYFDRGGTTGIRTSAIRPTDDTYIYGDAIHGMEEFLLTYHSTVGNNYKRESYLKFDLAGLSPYLEHAELKLYVEKLNEGHQFDLYPVALNTWAEDGVMYSDRAQKLGGSVNNLLATCEVSSGGCKEGYLSWSSDALKKIISDSIVRGSRYISFLLKERTSMKDGGNKGVNVRFRSKEHPSGCVPVLTVESKEMKHLYAKMINVDGKGIAAFAKANFKYTVSIPWNATIIPTLTAGANPSAHIKVIPAKNLNGTESERTSIIRLSYGKDAVSYYVTFERMCPPTEATLSDLIIQNHSLKAFAASTVDYLFYLPYSATEIPAVQAVAADPNATIQYTCATAVDGSRENRTTVIHCTSANGEVKRQYRVEFVRLPELDLFLALGQSNMSGRASYEDYKSPLQDVYLLNDAGEMGIATNPMNQYSNIRKDIGLQALSPAYAFGRDVQKSLQKPIGMLVNAQGGSSITLWAGPGKINYDASLRRAREIQKFGRIKGIIWHQGSADNGSGQKDHFVSYKNAMKKMVESFRTDLNEPDLIFICGDLADRPEFEAFNNTVVRAVGEYIPNATFISAEGTQLLPDHTHFDTESYILLGERYAKKYLQYR